MGAALALLAGALIIAGRFLVPQETTVEQRPMYGDREASAEVAEQLERGLDGITRRRLLGGAASIAGAGIAAAVVIPVVALGPGVEEQLSKTPWRAGRALVDEEGNPIMAADVNEGSFVTAFPEGAEKDNLGSPVVVVRVDPSTLALPADAGVVGARRDPRVLEDLHPRGVRHLAVPLALESHHPVAWAGTRLPMPLLHVRCARRRQRRVRSRGAGAAPTAAADRRIRRPHRRRSDVGPRRAILVGGQPVSRPEARGDNRAVDAVGFVDERLGAARGVRFLLDYVFPDHWSFLLGEIALYSFIILIATGTFLALFFDPSTSQIVYHGSYRRCRARPSRPPTHPR